MNIKQQKEMLETALALFEQKGIDKEETQQLLEEIFVKAFERDGRFNIEDPIPEAKIESKVDLDAGIIEVKRFWEIVEEVEEENRLIHCPKDSELLEGSGLTIGDTFVEDIDLENILYGKAQHIKQLLIQKTRESEKLKLYEKFKDKKGELIRAKVFRMTPKFSILEYDGVSIFMHLTDHLLNEDFQIGDLIYVYVVEIEKISKDAQIIGSRANINFVKKLIEKEIEDVMDGVVKIESIARQLGVKSKVSVSSTLPEVDPVGSIIGIRGKKIAPIIDELKGERIDIIKYEEDIKKYVAEALLPATIIGAKVVESDVEGEKLSISVIVEEDQFLPALGKRGINVMLAARLTQTNIDVKTIKQAEEAGIEYDKVEKSSLPIHRKRKFDSTPQTSETYFDLDEFSQDAYGEETEEDENMFGDYFQKQKENEH